MARKLAGVVFAVSTLHASVVHALGLGEIELKSTLNEPLRAEIAVLNTGDLDPQQLTVRLAGPDEFARAGVERVIFLKDLEFAVKFDGRGSGVIVVTSDNLVREPYLDFVLEARWPDGQMNREYTLLVDLPAFSDEIAVAPTQASAAGKVAASEPVRVRAPAPARSAAALAPLLGGEITTRRNDTLWGLALKAKPAGVSEQQAMMAIYRKNPDAFERGNINGLLEGKVVRLPEREEYDALSRQQAIQSVAEHNGAWKNRGVAPLDGRNSSASEPEVVGGEESFMKLSSSGTAEASVAGAAGGTGQAPAPAEDALQGELNAASEKLDSAERENAELNSRLGELQEQLATLEKLVELKDEQLASMQAQLSQEPAEVASAPVDNAAESPAVAVEEPVVSIEQEAGPGIVGRLMSPLYLGLGGGLLALGAVGTVARRRRKEEEAVVAAEEAAIAEEARASLKARAVGVTATDAEQANADEASQEILATLGDQPVEAEPAQSETEVAIPSTGDPVAEAEIYCSYGRHDEAIAMLEQAIDRDPGRAELHMTLLGILADQDRREPFQAAFAKLERMGDQDTAHLARHLVADRGWLDGVALADMAVPERVEQADEFELDLDLDLDLGGTDKLPLDNADSTVDYADDLTLDLDGVSLDDNADSGDLDFSLHLVDDDAPQDAVDLGVDAAAIEPSRDSDTATFDSILNADESKDQDLEKMFEGDEIGTKLDLARAYVDMGDVDGARDILDEVIQEGSDGQKQEASELLNLLAG